MLKFRVPDVASFFHEAIGEVRADADGVFELADDHIHLLNSLEATLGKVERVIEEKIEQVVKGVVPTGRRGRAKAD